MNQRIHHLAIDSSTAPRKIEGKSSRCICLLLLLRCQRLPTTRRGWRLGSVRTRGVETREREAADGLVAGGGRGELEREVQKPCRGQEPSPVLRTSGAEPGAHGGAGGASSRSLLPTLRRRRGPGTAVRCGAGHAALLPPLSTRRARPGPGRSGARASPRGFPCGQRGAGGAGEHSGPSRAQPHWPSPPAPGLPFAAGAARQPRRSRPSPSPAHSARHR